MENININRILNRENHAQTIKDILIDFEKNKQNLIVFFVMYEDIFYQIFLKN
jgi:hypothetical protein